jgi:hypothetical protein
MAYVPADSAGFVHIRLRDVWNTEGFAELRKIVEKAGPQAKATLDESFVPAPSGIDRMTLVFFKAPKAAEPPPGPKFPIQKGPNGLPKKGPPIPPPPPPPFPPVGGAKPGGFDDFVSPLGGDLKVVIILAFNAPFDAAKVREAHLKKPEKKTIGEREYWDDPESSYAAYFPSDTVMVLGDGAGLKLYLTRLATTGGALASAIEHARTGGFHVVAALNVAQLGLNAKMLENVSDEYKGAAKHAQVVMKAESLMLGVAIGEETRIDIRAKYKDDAAASESESALRELAKLGREKLAEPKKQMEAALNGPPKAPKPRPIKDLPTAIGGLVGLGSLNALDEWLADPPLKTDGSEVVLTPKVPSLASIYASTIAVSVGLWMPAVDKIQAASTRTKDSNNLKQLGLAMIQYHEATGSFPPQDGKMTPNAKGGLSWRVHLLPYIEQEALYKQFKLDEPWDSEHNMALVAKMPPTYASPFVADPPGQTRYKVFSGPDAVVYPGSRTTLPSITDGASNTILVVGGGKPVTWTKPDDIEFTGTADPSVLALPDQRGCNVLLCDGSVRWIDQGISPRTLKAAITRNGGEVPGPDW